MGASLDDLDRLIKGESQDPLADLDRAVQGMSPVATAPQPVDLPSDRNPAAELLKLDPATNTDLDSIPASVAPKGMFSSLFRPWGPWDSGDDFMGWVKSGMPLFGREVQAGSIQGILGTLRGPGRSVQALEKAFDLKTSGGLHGLTFATLKGIANLSEELENKLVEPLDENASIPQQMQRGFGSAIPFLAGGVAGKAAELPAWLVPTVMGASQGSTAQYEEALAMGADSDQALLANVGGAAFGATEGIPAAYFLGKLNKLTGGKTAEALRKLYEASKGNPGIEAVKGAIVEALQEGTQTLGSNWVASDLAAYDPDRTLSENLVENVATGGVIGSLLGGGFGLVRSGEHRMAERRLEQIRKDLLELGDPINLLDGSFTPVQALVGLNKMKGDVDTQLAEAGRIAQERQAREGLLEVNQREVGGKAQGPDYLGDTMEILKQKSGRLPVYETVRGLPIDTTVESGLPKKSDGAGISVGEALRLQPVVAMKVNPYEDLANAQDGSIKRIQNILKEVDSGISVMEEGKEQELRRGLAALLKAREGTKVKTEIAKRLVKHVKDYAAAFQNVFTPDMRLVITDQSHEGPMTRPGALGRFAMTEDVELEPGKKTPVGIIFMKMDDMITEIYNIGHGKTTESARAEKRMIFEVLSHELGHSLMTNSMIKWLDQAAKGDPKSAQMIALMRDEYGRWLRDTVGPEAANKLITKFAPELGMGRQASMSFEMEDWDKRSYHLSFDEFFADMTARLAAQGQLADPVMTEFFKPVLRQYEQIFEKFPEFAKNQYGNNWRNFLESQTLGHKIGQELEGIKEGGAKDSIDAIKGNVPGFNPEAFAGHEEWKDRWNRFMELTLNLEQMVKENPHIQHWAGYRDAIEAMETYRRRFAFEVDGTIKAWRSLGKQSASKVTDVLFEEALEKKKLTPEQLSDRLNGEEIAVYTQIRNNLSMALEEMRKVAVADAQKSFGDNSEILANEIKGIDEDFENMEEQGYFPFIRFGKWTVTARAKQDMTFNGNEYKKGQLISFPTFETQKERDEFVGQIRSELGDKATVAPSVMKEVDFQIQGLPRAVIRSLRRKLESTGDLTQEMRNAFDAALAESTPFRNFRKHFLKKKGIHGYSLDGMRSFAEYMGRAAGHIARVKHADDIRGSVDRMQQDVERIKLVGGDATKRQKMVHWMQRHYDYVMNPENEWAPLRGLGFQLMLGYNIKSALVNAMQIPSVTYPYLASRYGDGSAVQALSGATWTLKDWISAKKNFIDAMPDENGHIKKANDKKKRIGSLLAQGQQEDWLDQSLATELAIARSENNLNRGLHLPKGKRFWHNFSRYGAMPFHLVEKMNRYITAIATYELAYKETGDHARSVQLAKQAVRSTQYEHARWNRPEFMRGKKSLALLFANYLQNTVYFATRDKGALRYWMVLLALAGMQGLPFAEDVADLADAAGTYLKRQTGMRNPKVDVRREAREMLEELHANPDLILHGLSQDSFGLGKIGELTGTPIPRFDLSGSVGMGNILPLTEIPKAAMMRDPNDTLTQALFSAGGAGGSVLEDYYRGIMSRDPDDWKRAESLLPTAPRNFSKAIRLFMRGAEKTRAGDVVAEFDPADTRDRLELAGQALGFTPSRLRTGWEREIAVKEAITYYKLQQTELLAQHNWAMFNDDREAEADVMAAIREYNDQVPMPEMVITGKAMKDSFRAYFEKRALADAGIASEKKYRRLREKIEASYPDPYGDSLNKAEGDLP